MANEIILRQFTCKRKRCGKKFYSRFENPKQCGKCGSRSWARPDGVKPPSRMNPAVKQIMEKRGVSRQWAYEIHARERSQEARV